MTITEAATRIGKHNDTIRRAIQAGKLESTKVVIADLIVTSLSIYCLHLVHNNSGSSAFCSDSNFLALR